MPEGGGGGEGYQHTYPPKKKKENMLKRKTSDTFKLNDKSVDASKERGQQASNIAAAAEMCQFVTSMQEGTLPKAPVDCKTTTDQRRRRARRRRLIGSARRWR
jgi:hypothetical protein